MTDKTRFPCAGEIGTIRRVLQGAVLGVGFSLSACAPANSPPASPAPHPVVSSTDFALLPCGPGAADRPCAFVMAGGKRVLFGAPAGVLNGLSEEDLANLDAVMLFSLRAEDIEGLDEVRNASWRAGRTAPLKVSGPDGIAEMIAALNVAYEASDAIAFVERGSKGGFDSAVLVAGDSEGKVFDTGDLLIQAGGFSDMSYLVSYAQKHVQLAACQNFEGGVFDMPNISMTIECSDSETSWPLTAPIFITG